MLRNWIGLTVPAYRNDVVREADIIEEVLRVYGYNNIKTTEKLNASISNTSRFEDYKLQNIVGNQLVAQGFYEILSNSLTTPDYVSLTDHLEDEHNVVMLNPLSNDLSVMRQSLLFSGLEAINRNINRRRSDLKLFEFGKTYHNYPGNRVENQHLTLFLTGDQTAERWNSVAQPSNFFYLKGIITAVLERLGINKIKVSPIQNDVFSEGISLVSGKKTLVEFGVINKKIMNHFDISQNVLFADFHWYNVIEIAKNNTVSFKELPKYPESRRDFACY